MIKPELPSPDHQHSLGRISHSAIQSADTRPNIFAIPDVPPNRNTVPPQLRTISLAGVTQYGLRNPQIMAELLHQIDMTPAPIQLGKKTGVLFDGGNGNGISNGNGSGPRKAKQERIKKEQRRQQSEAAIKAKQARRNANNGQKYKVPWRKQN